MAPWNCSRPKTALSQPTSLRIRRARSINLLKTICVSIEAEGECLRLLPERADRLQDGLVRAIQGLRCEIQRRGALRLTGIPHAMDGSAVAPVGESLCKVADDHLKVA